MLIERLEELASRNVPRIGIPHPRPPGHGEAGEAEDELYPGEAAEDGSGLWFCHKTCVAQPCFY